MTDGGTVVVLGLGPVGDLACRISAHKGYRVIGVDLVPERLARVAVRGVEVVDLSQHEDDLGEVIREMTGGRGPDSVIDAVGMEAHGSPATTAVQKVAGLLPSAIAAPIQEKVQPVRQAGQLRMGQCNLKRWVEEIMPLLTDEDPLGVDGFATHRLPLEDAPGAYRAFQEKRDGHVKVLLRP